MKRSTEPDAPSKILGNKVSMPSATPAAPSAANFDFERMAKASGFLRIAGVDEAGRGPLAGPISAAAVVLAHPLDGLNDSKQLSEAQREALYEALLSGGHAIGAAMIPPRDLDRMGLQAANYRAMLDAVNQISPPPDFLLVDGFAIPGCAIPQERIIKGDARSISIAAASIVAKVTRDRVMRQLDAEYPEYGFAENKGYGTAAHLAALAQFGPCPAHRSSFAPVSGMVQGQLFGEAEG